MSVRIEKVRKSKIIVSKKGSWKPERRNEGRLIKTK